MGNSQKREHSRVTAVESVSQTKTVSYGTGPFLMPSAPWVGASGGLGPKGILVPRYLRPSEETVENDGSKAASSKLDRDRRRAVGLVWAPKASLV